MEYRNVLLKGSKGRWIVFMKISETTRGRERRPERGVDEFGGAFLTLFVG